MSDESVSKLRFMLGTFSGEERSLGGQPSRGELIAVEALGGRGIVSDYAQRVDSEVVFWGHGVYTFDASSRHYVMTWFDSARGAEPVSARGAFEGSRLTFEADGERGKSRYVYDVREAGYDFSIQIAAEDGTWQVFLEASYERVIV